MNNIIGNTSQKVSAEEYLIIWIGLVGSAVGLTLPKEIAIHDM